MAKHRKGASRRVTRLRDIGVLLALLVAGWGFWRLLGRLGTAAMKRTGGS